MLGRESPPLPLPTPAKDLRILVIDDESSIRGPLGLCLETLGHRVTEAVSAEQALQFAGESPFDVALVDIRLGTASGLDLLTQLHALQPRLKMIVITAYASVEAAVSAMARGATDFLCKPFTPDQLEAAVGRVAQLNAVEASLGLSPDHITMVTMEGDFATTSAALQAAIGRARRLAPERTPVLITGESGTGKKALAHAMHAWGARLEGTFAEIDCASRSPAYVDLAVFGESVVANQTVTARQAPLVTQCLGGTLLLAHVEALPPDSQAKLLQVLTRPPAAGGEDGKAADVRVIATSTAPDSLTTALKSKFLEQRIELPPLRERAEDIPALAQRHLAFLREKSGRPILGFSLGAIDALVEYSWPGNLAQLRKVVAEAMAATPKGHVERHHLPESVQRMQKSDKYRPRAGDPITLEQMETAHIRAVIASAPSLQAAAEMLGLDMQALYRRRRQYGIT